MGNITADEFARAKEKVTNLHHIQFSLRSLSVFQGDEALMQTYLNKTCFREKIFRLRISEETFNVSRTTLSPSPSLSSR